ncbi:hypothetical protein BN59_00852 [Legionella massiliensis]|uniref:Uncharacterized protein n=1 Tax=Legionella massiliensis TaxID=1034943 RepID=A0A078KXX0_9GAMM|nr:hypothetical protein [Legionella massiliensis]CDZ76578.1 hypothetical protein BN59_00852 [Legionella massiliensis]CEE12316.1 hypothetical protein BN1094_00852 [Legionella massiliensis]
MSSTTELTILAKKFKSLMAQRPRKEFPDNLQTELSQLRHLIQSEDTRLSQAAAVVLSRAYLIAINLLNAKSPMDERGKAHIAENLASCIALTRAVLTEPNNKKARTALEKMLRSSAFELRAFSSSAKHYALASIDAVVNTINRGRAFIFQTAPHPRSRFASQDILEEKLESFLLVANQPSTAKLLSSLSFPLNLPAEKGGFHYLIPALKERYRQFREDYEEDEARIVAISDLLKTLDELGREAALVKDNQALRSMAIQAFYASQDFVIDLLAEKNPALPRVENLNACLQQTILVIKNPGQQAEILKLDALVTKSDYKRFQCDKEKTTYAVLHIIAAAALLAHALFEAVASHGISLIITAWVITAEASSLGVGLGQLYYFLTGEIKNTLFSESMANLSIAARLKGLENSSEDRGHALYSPSNFADVELNEEITELQVALIRLRNHSKDAKAAFLSEPAWAVLLTGEDLASDLLRESSPSIERIQKLRECIEAADAVVCQPNDLAATIQLAKLINEGDYEASRLDKYELFIGSVIALASIALYVITITATVLSAGSTAGTILSAVMLSAVAAHKLAHCVHREQTSFSVEAKALTEYAQFAGNTFFPPPEQSKYAEDGLSYSPSF